MNSDDRELGMHVAITRRDFVKAVAVGSGAALLTRSAAILGKSTNASPQTPNLAADFNGFTGVGDYQRSNGNTWDVVQTAHKMRDGGFATLEDVEDTGETYDVVIVGGGFAGMGAAHHMMQLTDGKKSCLVLENHPLWGGEAKRNEFLVDGVRLMGPQGSNDFSVPRAGTIAGEVWSDLGLPREFAYSELAAGSKALSFSKTNFDHQLWLDNFESHGFWFPEVKRWVTNPWGHDLAGVPWPDEIKRDFLRWRKGTERYYSGPAGADYDRYLDSMTYEHYLTRVMGLRSEVARYTDPILAASGGLGSDVTSAYLAAQFLMPGFQGMNPDRFFQTNHRLDSDTHGQRFPGGNDAIMRALLKRLVPSAIRGSTDFADIHNGAVQFDQLDRPGQSTRIRLAAMAVDVRHTGPRGAAEGVDATYALGGRLHRVHARAVVVCSGSWTAKHIVRELPAQHLQALQQFYRSPMLVLNVALSNWRPLYKLGYTAASWRGGFGFTFNLAPPMRIGKLDAILDPDRPAVITFYVPVTKVGRPIQEQGPAARAEVLSKPYREYEYLVRAQLTEMLGPHGFDPRRDIRGIILNRWGHAYVDPYPGFFFGKDGKPAPSEVVRQPFGRISFGHSELRGHQFWNGGLEEGRRALEQALQHI
jgi:spermidine dehydrogenase